MIDFVSLSPEALADRRRVLRRQRRIRNLQGIWRLIAVSGMAVGALWLISHPLWLLYGNEQVIIDGNQLLSDEALQSLLPLDYPQPLLEVEPILLVEALKIHGPVLDATVTRQMLPPRLLISVQERQPVAMTVPTRSPSASEQNLQHQMPTHRPGLIDSQGHWIALAQFTDIEPDVDLPKLMVQGFRLQYQDQWPSLYQVLQEEIVKVSELDWRAPDNLILHTELGVVHLGIYDAQTIRQQLATLVQLSSLAQADKTLSVEYIDLSNPDAPAIKIKPAVPDEAGRNLP